MTKKTEQKEVTTTEPAVEIYPDCASNRPNNPVCLDDMDEAEEEE